MLREIGLTDMQNILVADIQPMYGKAKLRVFTTRKAKVLAKPVSRSIRIVGQDQDVLHKSESHSLFLLNVNGVYLLYSCWNSKLTC